MGQSPDSVHRVAPDGRYRLPQNVRDELAGEYLAAFVEDDCIRLEPVRGGEA